MISDALLPDFVKLAEAYHAVGIRCERPGDVDGAIREMISVNRPVIFDISKHGWQGTDGYKK